MRSLLIAAVLALMPLAQDAWAQDSKPVVTAAWARATPGQSKIGAAYLTIESPVADRIVSAASPVAARAEMHAHTTEGGVMKMRQVDGITVTPGTPTVLKPGGLHIMLIDLKAPLVEGQSFLLALTLEKAGEVDVMVKVEKAGASGTAMPPHDHAPKPAS
jgi:copper(I)-binding protein